MVSYCYKGQAKMYILQRKNKIQLIYYYNKNGFYFKIGGINGVIGTPVDKH